MSFMNKLFKIEFLPTVSYQDKLIFTKHLATMIKAGIPIAEALDTLREQANSEKFRKVIKDILENVENGKSLAQSLKKHPKIFDQFYFSLIDVGEESGTLEENLEFLAVQLSKDSTLRKKIRGALVYPVIVLSVTFIMGGFISIFVLPKLVDFFQSFDIELPLTTKVLIVFSKLMKDYGILIFSGVFVFFILLRVITKMEKIKPIWHNLLLRTPIIGRLLSYGQLARFSRNLGTMIKSGVPVVKGLEVTAKTLSNLKFRNDLLVISKSLSKGKSIGETMRKGNFPEYPPLVSRMIGIGEKTGKLDETLIYLSEFYEEEVDDISKNLSTILEPILLIIIGLVVGFVALSIISPIYQLTGSIRR